MDGCETTVNLPSVTLFGFGIFGFGAFLSVLWRFWSCVGDTFPSVGG